jgi:hypothetical protein
MEKSTGNGPAPSAQHGHSDFFGDVSGENKVVIGNVANVNPGLINLKAV